MKQKEPIKLSIGDVVVAIANHTQGHFKIGDEFEVDGVLRCKCGTTVLILTNLPVTHCIFCKHQFYERCYDSSLFKIKEVKCDYTEITFERIAKTVPHPSVN